MIFKTPQCCPLCKWYFRDVLFYTCGGAAILGAAALLTLARARVGERRRDRVERVEVEGERRSLLGEERTVYS